MRRKSLLAAIMVTSALAYPQLSAVAATASHVFEGTVATTNATAECAAVADIHAQKALFRPHLGLGEPNAAIILGGDGPSNGLGQLQDQSPTNRNMQGSGSYDGSFFLPESGQTVNWSGTYVLSVTPTVVQPATIYVTVTGTILNFANVSGCTLTINGAFIQPVAP